MTDQWGNDEAYAPGLSGITPDWGALSPHGCAVPDPPAGLRLADATSPARRSPRVRAAQAIGSRRPDLLPRVNALDV